MNCPQTNLFANSIKADFNPKFIFRNFVLYKLCYVIILVFLSPLFISCVDISKEIQFPSYQGGLSKELEDSLIEAKNDGVLIDLYIKIDEELREKRKWEDIISISNWIEDNLERGRNRDIAYVYEIRSIAHLYTGNYEAMFEDIEKFLDLPKNENILLREGFLYLYIMDFHLSFDRLDLVQKYLEKAKQIELKMIDLQNIDTITIEQTRQKLNYLIHLMEGQLYRLQKKWDAAEAEYEKALKYISNDIQKIRLCIQKYFLYVEKGEYELANDVYIKHLKNNRSIPFIDNCALRLEYVNMIFAVGNIEAAKNEFIKISPDSLHISYLPDLYIIGSNIFEQEGNYPLAYDYLAKSVVLKDSLETEYKIILAKHTSDHFEMRQMEKNLENEQKGNIRNFILIGLLIVALIGTAIFIIIIIRRYKKRKCAQIIAETNLGNRNASLSSSVLLVNSLNDIYKDIKNIIDSKGSASDKLNSIHLVLKVSNNSIEPLHHVKDSNDSVVQEFIDKLRYVHPDLTNAEIRMAQFVIMNMANKDIAELQNKSLGTIKNQKYSLRKKLKTDLPTELYLKQLSAASYLELEELAKLVQNK